MGFFEIVGWFFVAFVAAMFWDAKEPEPRTNQKRVPVRVRPRR